MLHHFKKNLNAKVMKGNLTMGRDAGYQMYA